nr:trigger factor-like [Nicotiana tomentosiformis]
MALMNIIGRARLSHSEINGRSFDISRGRDINRDRSQKDAILRPPSGEKRTKSPVPKSGKDKKRKAVFRFEDPKPKTLRVKRKEIALSMESVQRLREEEEDGSALVVRSAKAIEIARPSEPMIAIPAISKFRADLSQCEVDLQKETILAKLLPADVELRNIKQKGSAQAKRIRELEARLAEAKAGVESSKVMADKSIAVYRADAEASQMEAREAADAADTRAHRAKELEADVEALVSDGDDDGDDDDDDDDDDDSKGGSDDEGEPGGEETALDDNPEA